VSSRNLAPDRRPNSTLRNTIRGLTGNAARPSNHALRVSGLWCNMLAREIGVGV